jgi:hypothetical protein
VNTLQRNFTLLVLGLCAVMILLAVLSLGIAGAHHP